MQADPSREKLSRRGLGVVSSLVVLMMAFCSIPEFGRAQGRVVPLGMIKHPAITESSGLAASKRYPGVIWTHNDSGGSSPFIFAMRQSGEYLRAFPVRGANLIDWEDIAIDHSGNLYLADIGADGMPRSHVAIHRVREPDPERIAAVRVDRTWYLRFPRRRADCESFFVSRGAGYLVTKEPINAKVTIYSFPLSAAGDSILLRTVAHVAVTAPVTAADISHDSRRLALLTEHGPYVFAIDGNVARTGTAPRTFVRLINTFMEGACFVGPGLLVSAETRQLWLFSDPPFRTR